MDAMLDAVAFVIKVVALGAVACAVFEFVMWRLFRADLKAKPAEKADGEPPKPVRST